MWAEKWDYARRAIAPALALLEANRASIAEILRATPNALEQSVLVQWCDKNGHTQERATSVSYVLESQTRHVVDHVAEIRKIRQTHNR